MNKLIFEHEFMENFCEAALKIGEYKMQQIEDYKKLNPPKIKLLPRIATGGGFSGLFLWDTVFCIMWAKHAPKRFPLTSSLDNLYNLQQSDGYICREFQADGTPFWAKEHPISFNPPILAWAELELFEYKITDETRLLAIYDNLYRHHEFCYRTYQRSDGLFFSDALGGGMDSLPRMPYKQVDMNSGIRLERKHLLADREDVWNEIKDNPLYSWNKQMGWVDCSAQMAFNALNLAKIAHVLGRYGDETEFRRQHKKLRDAINDCCYCNERGFYFDYFDGEVIPRYHGGAMWTLLAEIIPNDRAKKVVKVLQDPNKFYRPVVFPMLSKDDIEYDPENSYCLGPVWPYITYVALRGLNLLGYNEFALECARKYYRAYAALFLKTNTVWENVSPEQYDHPKILSGKDFCGWGAIAPVAIYHEFLSQDVIAKVF